MDSAGSLTKYFIIGVSFMLNLFYLRYVVVLKRCVSGILRNFCMYITSELPPRND